MITKKKLHLIVYVVFGLFILGNILFFFTDFCFGCKVDLINETAQVQEIKTINLEEWKNLYDNKDEDIIILDLRTLQEFNSGNIDGAINIDFYAYDLKIQLDKLDKNKIYLIYCRSGSRAGQSLNIFKKLGFKKVYNLDGGISVWS